MRLCWVLLFLSKVSHLLFLSRVQRKRNAQLFPWDLLVMCWAVSHHMARAGRAEVRYILFALLFSSFFDTILLVEIEV